MLAFQKSHQLTVTSWRHFSKCLCCWRITDRAASQLGLVWPRLVVCKPGNRVPTTPSSWVLWLASWETWTSSMKRDIVDFSTCCLFARSDRVLLVPSPTYKTERGRKLWWRQRNSDQIKPMAQFDPEVGALLTPPFEAHDDRGHCYLRKCLF